MIPLRNAILLLTTAATLTGAAVAQAGRDPFVGRFRGEKTELSIEAGAERYRGTMTIGGKRLTLSAVRRAMPDRLVGDLRLGARDFGFEAFPTESGLRVLSGGKERSLSRVAARSAGADTPKRLRLRKVAIRDRMVQNVESHTMLLPDGYRAEGGVVWTPNAMAFQTMDLRVHDGRGAEFRMRPAMTFRYEPPQQLAMRGLRVGMVAEMGSVIRPAPQREFEEFTGVVFPSLRPHAERVQILEQRREPERERFFIENSSIMQRQGLGHESRELRCVSTRVRYVEDGREYEEQVSYVYFASGTLMSEGFVQYQLTHWYVDGIVGVRAPRETFEQRAVELQIVGSSLRTTPLWFTCQQQIFQALSAMRHRANMDRIQALGQISRQFYESNRELSDSQMASWRRQQESSGRVQRRAVDSIWEVERFQGRDGLPISVGHRFDRVFESTDGTVIAVEGDTWTPMEDPSLSHMDWKRLGRADG